ncbi:UNVERIFIED_CONTAM: hypothetical protein PYX00_011622 [Menopon gallinae]|uniref:DNA topoisomerase n=1 Tax=Menopon gallinae TaxID=328185 RepID=A0AAW2H896_9NEOP
MKVLNIAEKPSVAKSISSVLSTSYRTVASAYKYCPNIHFKHQYNGRECDFVFTSVLGHLLTTDFVMQHRWNEVDPETLFEEKIVKFVKDDMLKLKENIERNVSQASLLIIWTDCDREGENIARQISNIALGTKAIEVRRARFFGISKREISDAINNLTTINELEADAVDARIELDLRIGSSFTRLQTLSLQGQAAIGSAVISYGSCQIPTLGFVVERERAIEEFIEEPFWTLHASVHRDGVENVFHWERTNLFDRNCVVHFLNTMQGHPAHVVQKEEKPKEKLRPLPLRTVEFQKVCTSYFKISAHRLMEKAEALYNRGYISYPRTETDSFGKGFKFKSILSELEKDTRVGDYAQKLQAKHVFPRSGKNNDMAHLPIYPLKSGNGLSGDEQRIFEFVARRFLACLSENAKAVETNVVLRIREETFKLTGLRITARNYLEIYTYDKWENKVVGSFERGETIRDLDLKLVEGATTPPEYLTEAELISLMDKHGIGTDATIHEHIQKIQVRNYARKNNSKIVPLPLGKALIGGYEVFGLDFSKPRLRSELEQSLRRVEKGETSRDCVVREQLSVYRGMYRAMKSRIDEFVGVFRNIEMHDPSGEDGDRKQRPRHSRARDTGSSSDAAGGRGRQAAPGRRPAGEGCLSDAGERGRLPQRKAPGDSGCIAKEEFNDEVNALLKTVRKNASAPLKCKCKQDAKSFKVTKKNKNCGRTFYCCGMFPKRCDMFVWEEDVSTYTPGSYDTDATATGVKCHCGYETKLFTAHSGPNSGKAYLKCKKLYKPCNFFQWWNM